MFFLFEFLDIIPIPHSPFPATMLLRVPVQVHTSTCTSFRMSTTSSIIISSASAVGKTFLIGAVGYCAVKLPRSTPILPVHSINMLSRLTFNILLLPLIFTGVASSVTLESLSSLWLVVVASFVIISVSFVVATALAYLPFFRVHEEEHFSALVIAICFPNIVAIPILIFPALCEYEAFHEYGNIGDGDGDGASLDQNIASCEAEANAVVFAYFFGFSVLFWSFGDRSLRNMKDSDGWAGDGGNENNGDERCNTPHERQYNVELEAIRNRTKCGGIVVYTFYRAMMYLFGVIKDIFLSPGFIVLILSFVTACFPFLQNALFEPGGFLRVIGSTLESLSSAGATFATIVVAAALADDSSDEKVDGELAGLTIHQEDGDRQEDIDSQQQEITSITGHDEEDHVSEGVAMSNNNKLSEKLSQFMKKPTFRVQAWHVTSRLFVTPAVIFGILLKVEYCPLYLSPISKLVLLINSSLPGALIVVVILKTNGFTKAANTVSQTYLPSK